MQHQTRDVGSTSVVSFQGEVDLENSPTAREVLLDRVRRGRDLVVDLSGVSYIDSSGIASLVEAFQEARKQGTRFALAAVSPSALRVFELARLDQVFAIHATLEDALAHGG
jgi:anti-sigma B factor antagonist